MAELVNFDRRQFMRYAAAGLSVVYVPAARSGSETLVLGTATAGGGFEVYGKALADVLNAANGGIRIEPRATKGTKENLPLLEAGKLDLGLVEGTAAHEAHAGMDGPAAKSRIVWAMYPNPGMFVVRADSPYRTIEDLKGKRVAFGARASGLVVLARYVLDGIGLDPQRDFEAVYLDKAAEGAKLVLAGEVAALWGGGMAWPGFRQVADAPAGARFIVPNAEQLARIQSRHAFLKESTVPAGSYRGQDSDLQSVGSWALVLARPTLSEQTAYQLSKALHANEQAFAARLAQARYSTAANTIAAAPRADLIHPGTQRLLRELGLQR